MISLLLLTLPLWIARYGIRREKVGWKGFEDLGVGALLLLFLCYVPYISYFVIPLIQVMIIADAYLEKTLRIRLAWSHFALIPQFREFIDSAKVLKLGKGLLFIPPLVVGGVLVPFHGSPWIFALLLLPLWTLFRTSGRLHSLFNMLLIGKKEFLTEFDSTPYLSKTERYDLLDQKYPLFRFTKGFRGEKAFELQIEKGETSHIIFLFIESLGKKEIEIPGLTPCLSQLKEEGIFFPNFYANSLQTFRALFSSLYGVPSAPTSKLTLDPSLPVVGLPDLLKEKGYQTNFFNGASWALNNLSSFLKEHGADSLIDFHEIQSKERFSWGVFDQQLYEYTFSHMKEHRGSPQFYTLMTITTHHPYVLPKHLGEAKGSDYQRYLKTLSYADACLNTFLTHLKAEGLLDNSLLFIMGDHGSLIDSKDERYRIPQESSIEDYHVPLIIYGKGVETPQVVSEEGSQCDLLPTVMDILHLKGTQHGMGRSLCRKEKHPMVLHHYADSESNFRVLNARDAANPKKCRDFIYTLHKKRSFYPTKKKEEIFSPSFNFSRTHAFTAEQLEEVLESSSLMESLDCEGSLAMTDQGLKSLSQKCMKLTKLNISRCPLVSLQGVQEVLMKSRLRTLILKGADFIFSPPELPAENLKSLELVDTAVKNLSHFPKIFPSLDSLKSTFSLLSKEELIECLAKTCVRNLYLYGCQNLTDDYLEKLVHCCRGLTTLAFIDCYQLTDRGLQCLENLKKLENLILVHPANLTDTGLEMLLNLPLSQLEVEGALGLTERGIEKARNKQGSYQYLRVVGGSLF